LWLTRDKKNQDLILTLPDGNIIKIVVDTKVQINVGIEAPKKVKIERPERERVK
jgi:sRNA-binding carbon storage regulator CsrA